MNTVQNGKGSRRCPPSPPQYAKPSTYVLARDRRNEAPAQPAVVVCPWASTCGYDINKLCTARIPHARTNNCNGDTRCPACVPVS